jgi:hypothetical protein
MRLSLPLDFMPIPSQLAVTAVRFTWFQANLRCTLLTRKRKGCVFPLDSFALHGNNSMLHGNNFTLHRNNFTLHGNNFTLHRNSNVVSQCCQADHSRDSEECHLLGNADSQIARHSLIFGALCELKREKGVAIEGCGISVLTKQMRF